MFRTPLIAAFALVAAAPSLPQAVMPAAAAAPEHAYAPIGSIRWSYGPGDQLRFSVGNPDHLNSTIGPDQAADVQAIAASLERAAPGEPLSFTLTREAGSLACTGRAESGRRASGTCRFGPDQAFAQALSRHGIAPENSDDILGLALVDAKLATLDALADDGFRFGDAGDLIAASALGVSAGYADDLRRQGLKVDELGDLIAAKALKIDSVWLGEMARAGYPGLAIDQAIQMRALGVTPDYAARMGRVLHAVHEIE